MIYALLGKTIYAPFISRTLTKHLDEVKKSVFKNESGIWTDKIEIEATKVTEKKRKQKVTEEEDSQEDAQESVSVEVVGEWNEKDATIMKLSRQEYYGRIPHNHRPPISPIIADPIFKNPNSFESMIEIFRHIQKKNPTRKWVAVVMDGVPYVLGLKVIAWSMICEECGDTIFKETGMKKHIKSKHEKEQKAPTFKLEFSNLLLIPGGGHVFMNVSYDSYVLLCFLILS